jgi:nucleoside phosphorylase
VNDFKTNQAGDLHIAGGDLVVAESTLQHQADIVWSEKCWIKHAPTLGAGLQAYLNDSGSMSGLIRNIRQELERDGMSVNSISLAGDAIDIDAAYL